MDPHDVFKIVVIGLIASTAMVSVVAQAWFKRPRAGGADSRQLTEIADRLARLEGAVDAIAVETERISEGQRFTTKLLSERAGAPAGQVRT
jgi:hypothetical protein